MLQSNFLTSDRTRLNTPAQIHQEGAGIADLIKYGLGFLRRQYLVIAVTAVLVSTSSVLYLRLAPPTYTAQVQVLLANPRAQFIQQQSLLADPVFDMTQIETQLQLLKSKAIATTVINQLKLEEDPDFNRMGHSMASLVQRVRAWIFASAASGTREADSQAHPTEAMIGAFLDRLFASRVGFSNVIEISFSSSNPERAAEIVNAVANAYVADQLDAKFEANRKATTWLQERLRDLGEQALNAQRAVDAYKAQKNIVSADGKPIDDQLITQLNTRLVAARAQTSEATAKLSRYESLLNSDAAKGAPLGNMDAIGPDALNSQIITTLRQQYLELARREAELSARVGRDHLAVVNIRNRMREFRTSILEEVKRLAEISRSEVELAKRRQQELEKQLSEAVSQARSTNSAELTIKDLESRAKGLRSLYETFLQRYMGSAQQETFPISETRVIFPASPPQSKSKPKTVVILGLGIVGGLALGLALAFLREVMDRVFRTTSQVETVLGLPCVSLIPLLRSPKTAKSAVHKRASAEDVRQRTISSAPGTHRAVIGMPLSRFTESIRSIKLAVDHHPAKPLNQVIGITSALPNEGKTTIAASLAQLVSHSGKRAIIVDCDLRNPSLSATLAPKAPAGIIEVANGSRSLEETIWRDPTTNLALLPAVRPGALIHTSEILCADTISKLFDRLRASYDYIIVDLPPLTPLVDVRATAPLIDCFILVVEWGRTRIDVVQHALHTAPNIAESLIGVVLNKTNIKAMARYDAYCSDYYHDSHYIRYGLSTS